MKLTYSLAAALLAAPLAAQDPCEGNGVAPNLYIESSPATLGGVLSLDMGDTDQPFGLVILSYSGGWGPIFHPFFQQIVCLDFTHPFYTVIPFNTDVTGNVSLAFPMNPALFGFPPLFADSANITGGQLALSKTIPVYFEFSDSYSSTGLLGGARGNHTATFLGQNGRDNRISVLIAGGGTGDIITPNAVDTTEIWNPLDRNFGAGPTMGVERAFHTATLLTDGRVLIAGGVTASGACTASVELYDPITKTLSFASAMSTPRAGHTATRLADGRVLVAGGLQDYTNAATQFATVLNTAQNTAEVFDPVGGTWTSVANTMQSKRSGQTATTMTDGRVLIVSGINGGIPTGFGTDVPTFTNSCDLYDPRDEPLHRRSEHPVSARLPRRVAARHRRRARDRRDDHRRRLRRGPGDQQLLPLRRSGLDPDGQPPAAGGLPLPGPLRRRRRGHHGRPPRDADPAHRLQHERRPRRNGVHLQHQPGNQPGNPRPRGDSARHAHDDAAPRRLVPGRRGIDRRHLLVDGVRQRLRLHTLSRQARFSKAASALAGAAFFVPSPPWRSRPSPPAAS